MDSHIKEFSVNLSQDKAGCTKDETPRMEASVDPASSSHIQLLSKENKTDVSSPSLRVHGLATADRGHATSDAAPIKVPTFRAESPFNVYLRPPSVRWLHLTSELPPRAADCVPHGQPSDVVREDVMRHTDCSTWSASKLSYPPVHAIPAREGFQSAISCTESVMTPVSPPCKVEHDAMCVCSLCGVTVLLIGTSSEQQEMWRCHVSSWVHQRTLRDYAVAQNRWPIASGEGINVSTTSPPSPSLSQLLDVITTSPVAHVAEEEAQLQMQQQQQRQGPYIIAASQARCQQHQKPQHQTASMRDESAQDDLQRHMPTINLQVSKELDFGSNPPNSSAEGETHQLEVDDVPTKNKMMLSPITTTGRYSEEPMNDLRPTRPNCNKNIGIQCSSSGEFAQCGPSDQPSAVLHNELIQRKERFIERALERYLARKERQQLLFCLRRWFNAMFVRVTNVMNVNSIHLSSTKRQLEGQSVFPVSAASTTREERSGERGTTTVAPTITTRPASVSTDGQKPSASPFMESCIKDYAHVHRGSISSSSVELEVAKTDVSWFVRPRRHRRLKEKRQVKERTETEEERKEVKEGEVRDIAMHSSTTNGTFDSEHSSLEEIIAALEPALQSRVRAALRGEASHSSAFPKTLEALQPLRSSSFVSGTGPVWHSTCRSMSTSSLRSPAKRSASEESLAPPELLLEPRASAPTSASLPTAALSPDAVSLPGDVPLTAKVHLTSEPSLGGGAAAVASPSATDPSPARYTETSSDATGHAAPDPARHRVIHTHNHRGYHNHNHRGYHRHRHRHHTPLLSPPARGGPTCFTGTPGEFYCYYRGAFHHVPDPKSDAFTDADGSRLPIYAVRRVPSPAPSPRRVPVPSPTCAHSPLGPGRLNTYCATCVARFNLVPVDQCMRPVADRWARSKSEDCAECNGAAPRRVSVARARAPSPRTAKREEEEEEKARLRRYEGRVRKHMKALLRHDLPARRGGRKWKEYTGALSEALEMLEALRLRRMAIGSS